MADVVPLQRASDRIAGLEASILRLRTELTARGETIDELRAQVARLEAQIAGTSAGPAQLTVIADDNSRGIA